jgi:hypothetical protein
MNPVRHGIYLLPFGPADHELTPDVADAGPPTG